MTSEGKTVLLGGGGHGRMLLEALELARSGTVQAILDADPALREVFGVPVLGDDTLLAGLKERGFTHFAVGVGSIGNPEGRRRLYQRAQASGLEPIEVRHPAALVSRHAVIGPGAQLMVGAVVNGGAVLGEHVLVNSRALVEHDCRIGDHAHIASGAVLCGAVRVGAGAHIGAGAVVRQGIEVGEGALVAAGAVVVRNVAPRTRVMGVPAAVR